MTPDTWVSQCFGFFHYELDRQCTTVSFKEPVTNRSHVVNLQNTAAIHGKLLKEGVRMGVSLVTPCIRLEHLKGYSVGIHEAALWKSEHGRLRGYIGKFQRLFIA